MMVKLLEYDEYCTVNIYLMPASFTGTLKQYFELLLHMCDDFLPVLNNDKDAFGDFKLIFTYQTHDVYFKGKLIN